MATLKNTIINTTTSFRLPSGTTAQRPTGLGAGDAGITRFNTTDQVVEAWDGTEWIEIGGRSPLGTQDNPAPSAAAIKAAGDATGNGAYWIDLPTVGATQIYCQMDNAGNGNGYMLALKASQGSTFGYSSSYWTSTNTLNATDLTRNNANAKYHVFNYYTASEFVAFFPDLNNGGQTSGFGTGWHWRQTGQSSTCLSRFQNQLQLSGNPRGESMWVGSGFSNQNGMQWYGFNYTINGSNAARWGFGWNNEGDHGSNDVTSGIGLARPNYSAGDAIYCCQGTTGVNRSARVEIWVQ